MKFHPTLLEGAYIIEPEPYRDERGMFARIYCEMELIEINHKKNIVQINHSRTKKKGTIRGLHYQRQPKAEIKIIKCLQGMVFDVIVDLRMGSFKFLQWHSEILSAENLKMMYIPEGFAHGYQTLEENTELLYLHTEIYSPKHEKGIRFDDPMTNISWPLEVAEISKKDRDYPLLNKDFKGIKI